VLCRSCFQLKRVPTAVAAAATLDSPEHQVEASMEALTAAQATDSVVSAAAEAVASIAQTPVEVIVEMTVAPVELAAATVEHADA
jgi:hypothetical protein